MKPDIKTTLAKAIEILAIYHSQFREVHDMRCGNAATSHLSWQRQLKCKCSIRKRRGMFNAIMEEVKRIQKEEEPKPVIHHPV